MDATWHSGPRGPTRAPTWRGCDVDFYIYSDYRVIIHISIMYSEFKLTLLNVAPCIPANIL